MFFDAYRDAGLTFLRNSTQSAYSLTVARYVGSQRCSATRSTESPCRLPNLPLASFCRETQNSTSKQAFVGFVSLFFS